MVFGQGVVLGTHSEVRVWWWVGWRQPTFDLEATASRCRARVTRPGADRLRHPREHPCRLGLNAARTPVRREEAGVLFGVRSGPGATFFLVGEPGAFFGFKLCTSDDPHALLQRRR